MPEDYRLFYERRAKQYAGSSDLEKGRIISIGNQLKSFSSMFLDYPNQAGRYQGTLLKTVNKQVFQPNHKPEAYFVAALALYRFEVATRRLPVAERAIKSFRYYLLLAFRYRFEDEEFQAAGHKKVSLYCNTLIEKINSSDNAKVSFDECCAIVREALENLNLPLDRDSAKSRPLVDEVKRLAKEKNPAFAKISVG